MIPRRHASVGCVQMRKLVRRLLVSLVVTNLFLGILVVSVAVLEGPVPTKMRNAVEFIIHDYNNSLMDKAERNDLTIFDEWILRAGLLVGTTLSRYHYPEASMILNHYVYGDGSTLQLPQHYFANSSYLNKLVSSLGDGDHGPLALKQHQDWRLSLALNPFYLSISGEKVRIYHPKVEFAPVGSARVVTVVPVGKLRVQIYDNLVSALDPTPFEAFAEWSQP